MSAKCDMREGCTNPVTHIGEKGFVYCASHAPDRRGYERCRKMRAWELQLITEGKQLPSYEPGPKPVANACPHPGKYHLSKDRLAVIKPHPQAETCFAREQGYIVVRIEPSYVDLADKIVDAMNKMGK